ncbi:SET and MYND domain-containing protein 4 [Hydra vulgaris]|uniref:SET and MYND domain-containing protein 4 n=1 Tax=Hydra vulgaris TaxID=6087 RepID=UPI001F5F0BDC|nr:SET and MYND domain-containing protein 4 [Hydra vulgaris]
MTKSFTFWFNKIKVSLDNGNKNEFFSKFSNQQTDFDRVSLLLNQPQIKDFVILKSFNPKCKISSECARNLGNRQYGNYQLLDALRSYSVSISLAEYNSKELALAYGNRSAVLFETKEYNICKADINAALMSKFPCEKKYKLYERLGKCYIKLLFYDKAVDALNLCIQFTRSSDLSDCQKNDKLKSINELIKNCQIFELSKCQSFSPLSCQNLLYVATPPVLLKKNVLHPSASDSLEIVSSSSQGRHAIATKDISAGEIVIVEKPYASLCSTESYETHCYHCLSNFIFSYPCRLCTLVNYCSISCEEESWKSFHRFECEYSNILENDDIGVAHLAMKIITTVGLKDLLLFQNTNSSVVSLEDVFSSAVSFEDDVSSIKVMAQNSAIYNLIYNLEGNSKLRKQDDIFRRALLSIYIGKILYSTNFCPQENLIIVCAHLLKHVQMLACNAFTISEMVVSKQGFSYIEDIVDKEIGSGVYETTSLLNHSCCPSVCRDFCGDIVVVRAIKYINKGEEISIQYGYNYLSYPKGYRQKELLERYFFKCQCQACSYNWPLLTKRHPLYTKIPKFRCLKCLKGYHANSKCCVVDDEMANLPLLRKKYISACIDVEKNGNAEINLPVLLEYLNLLSRKAVLPSDEFAMCQETVKLCFSLLCNCANFKTLS